MSTCTANRVYGVQAVLADGAHRTETTSAARVRFCAFMHDCRSLGGQWTMYCIAVAILFLGFFFATYTVGHAIRVTDRGGSSVIRGREVGST